MLDRTERTLSQMLHAIDGAADDDVAYITAATVNLYMEALRRISKRILLGPQDIRDILTIVDMITSIKDQGPALAPGRSHQPTEEEGASILEAVEQKVGRRT